MPEVSGFGTQSIAQSDLSVPATAMGTGLRNALVGSEGVTERDTPPTARERALFEAASEPAPMEFVRLCGVVGRDPRQVLDGFDAAPWRWLTVSFTATGFVTDSTRELSFPADVRARLTTTRRYVETPWWRRLGRY